MKNQIGMALAILPVLLGTSCDAIDDFIGDGGDSGKSLTFIDEFIIPDGAQFQGTTIGGLSSIDYANGNWYMISDDSNSPRFYTAAIYYNETGFTSVLVNSVVSLQDQGDTPFASGTVDPEALRVFDGTVIWASEGNINNGVDPFVRRATLSGEFVNETKLANKYKVSMDPNKGPRQNGVFEGLSLSADGVGFWVNMELPLKEDGPAPTLQDTQSPIRIAYIDKATGTFGKEFAYELDPVVRPSANGTSFELNGVVELLEYAKDQFLVLERSFSTGYDDGGNNVKIYDVDASDATDVRDVESLVDAEYKVAQKTLLFDFEAIRDQLTDGVVDNVEGITFGPDFANGNKSVVLVADNNFSAFEPQLNQFVLFELKD
ncbi:MAG: esterase-like activity of phytase family protein [Bacteroidota bacterium]